MKNLKVNGMTCDHCARRVTAALTAVAGVTHIEVVLKDGAVRIDGDADPAAIIRAITAAGYTVAA